MSTAIRATPDTAGRSVLLELSTWDTGRPLEVVRTDTNGVRKVRLPRGAAPTTGAYTVTDHEAALTGTVTYSILGTRTNEIANPSFVTNLDGWSGGTGATIARDTTTGSGGSSSLRLDSTIAGGYAQYSQKVTIPPELRSTSTKVFLSVWAKGTGTLKVEARGQDAANVTTQTADSGYVTLTANWVKYSVTVAIDANTAKVWPLFFQGTGGTISLWLDQVLCEINSPFADPVYFSTPQLDRLIERATSLEDAARPADVWIHAAAYPTSLPTVSGGILVDWRPTRDTGAHLVEVIGRADPIDTGPALARTRSLTIDVLLDSLAAARQLEDLVAAARTVVVRSTTPGLDTTLTVENIDGPTPDSASTKVRRWHVTLRGRESLTGPYLAEAA